MNIVFISNRLAVVWANLCPPAVATRDTARAKTELEFSCCVPRAQKHYPSWKRRRLGDVLSPDMTQQCDILPLSSGGQQGTCSQLSPPPSLVTPWCPGLASSGISAPEEWGFEHRLCGSSMSPWNFPKFNRALSPRLVLLWRGWTGDSVIFWWGRWWATIFSLLLSKDLIIPNFTWKILLKRSKNFLSFSPVPTWLCWNQPVHPCIPPFPPLFLSGEVPANKRTILLPSLT